MWHRTAVLLLTATALTGCDKVKATFDPAAGPRATLAKAQQFVESCDMQGFSQLLALHLRTRLDAEAIAKMEANCRKDQEAGTQTIPLRSLMLPPAGWKADRRTRPPYTS